ncbi:MAG TPA: CRTAC1 family protein [Thermoanaerobaculia bacterium]
MPRRHPFAIDRCRGAIAALAGALLALVAVLAAAAPPAAAQPPREEPAARSDSARGPAAAEPASADRPAGAAAPARPPTVLRVPTDVGESTLAERRRIQLAAASDLGVAADLRFTDRRAESGIAFRHRIVDDAGVAYKPVHYDHGNGVAAADVDGDGRLDLYLTTQLGSNQLWRNAGDGRFEDWTGRAGVAMTDRVSVAASFADVDNDGDPDLYVTTVRQGNALFRNDGGGRFTEITEAAGLAYSGHSSAAVFFDFDEDGWLDLFLVNVGRYTTDERRPDGSYVGRDNAFSGHTRPELAERSVLYQNQGDGTFRDVSQEKLLMDRGWSGDAVAADLDGDGWTDLYVLDMQGSDRFYQNVRGEFFVERSERHFPRTPAGSMGVDAFDWNRDGRLDLFVTDMHSDMAEELPPEREKEKYRRVQGDRVLAGVDDNILGNAFFEGGDDGYREVSDAIGVETYWPWGFSTGDLNADGWPDLYVTAGMGYPFRYGLDSLLLNDRGRRFRDAELVTGVEPRPELTQPWFELDCPERAEGQGEEGADGEAPAEEAGAALRWSWDALADAAAAAEDGRHPLCRGLAGRVEVVAARSSRSSVIFDLDGDGDLDVVTNEFHAAPRVLTSDLAQRRPVSWIEVDLVGTRSNRDGLGARVTVVAGGLSQLEPNDGKSGYLSQSSMPLWFGLGDAERVDRVEVVWPSGARQVVERPAAGRRLVVTEPAE